MFDYGLALLLARHFWTFTSEWGRPAISGHCAARACASQFRSGQPYYSGGRIDKVDFGIADDAYVDLERQLAAAMSRD